MKLARSIFGRPSTADLEAALAKNEQRAERLEKQRTVANAHRDSVLKARRALLLDDEAPQSAAVLKRAETAVLQATLEVEALDDALAHLRQDREGLLERLNAAKERDRREIAAAECERRAKLIEEWVSKAAPAARVIAEAASVLVNTIDAKELGLELSYHPLAAEGLSNAMLAAALRQASPYFTQSAQNRPSSLAFSLQGDARIRSRQLHDYLLSPEERTRLPTLDVALPELLRQRAKELRAGAPDAATDADRPAALVASNEHGGSDDRPTSTQ
jgi:hypothetical protein